MEIGMNRHWNCNVAKYPPEKEFLHLLWEREFPLAVPDIVN